MAAIPAAAWIMAAGTGAKMLGDRQQQRQQRAIINRAMEQTAKTQGATQQMIGDEGSKYAGDARAAAMQEQENAAFAQAQKDTQGATLKPAATAGRQSADYLEAQAKTTATEGDRLTAIAREAAKVRSPGRLLQAEGLRGADLQGRVGSMLSSDANMARAASQDAASVQAPLYGQLGGLAASLASMYGAAGGVPSATNYAMPSGVALWLNSSPQTKTYLNPSGARIRFGGP